MATVLALLTSGRRHGFTARLLDAAIRGIESIPGVEADLLCTQDFTYGPCTSCFTCIRDDEHVCVLDDDMGRRGRGEVFRRIAAANAIIIADPVHNWSPTASARLLIERCYPFLWSGSLKGMPSACISCASNQGMQRLARAELCKWCFGLRTRYQGGIAAHLACFDEALAQAEALGEKLAHAALDDATPGRQSWGDAECFAWYTEHGDWGPLQAYLDNLTNGTMRAETSVMADALHNATFTNPDAIHHLQQAQHIFRETVALYDAGEEVAAARSLAEASAHWTQATWQEFLEADVIGIPKPPTYRPTTDDE